MKVAVLDINGKETGRKADLSDGVFAIEQETIHLNLTKA